MTLSIVALCPDTGQLGMAAATGTPGVGKLLTWAAPNIGAVATQGWINPYLGVDGVTLLANGHPAPKVMQAVLALDDGREARQVGMVDAHGRTATWTGGDCENWAGSVEGEGFAVQGNLLESGAGVDACAEVFAKHAGTPLVERLMRALEAGCAAGGDRRGERSATVYVFGEEEYPLWDVRIDDSTEPFPELWRMQRLLGEQLLSQIRKMPTRARPSGSLHIGSRDGLA